MRSELQELREFKVSAIARIEGLKMQSETRREIIEDKDKKINELKHNQVPFDISSLQNQLKWELLKDHWEKITLEDLEAILPKEFTPTLNQKLSTQK